MDMNKLHSFFSDEIYNLGSQGQSIRSIIEQRIGTNADLMEKHTVSFHI
ncbi:hypothetical protein ES703_38627 [subsurface metagenome]